MLRARKNIRLRNYDYASDGWYFVTLCTGERECYFGKIENKTMFLSDIGIKARKMWTAIPNHFPMAELAEFVVMPNHIHGIIGIHHKYLNGDIVRTRHGVSPQSPQSPQDSPQSPRPNFNQFGKSIPGSLSAIIGQYKSSVTRWCNRNRAPFQWQSRFHDHIIRNQEEFDRIEGYIMTNIENWDQDKFYD